MSMKAGVVMIISLPASIKHATASSMVAQTFCSLCSRPTLSQCRDQEAVKAPLVLQYIPQQPAIDGTG